MRIWDPYLTDRDRQVFAAAGFGRAYGFGSRPALLVIDVTYGFVGDKPEPILESIKRWRHSCGEEGWAAVAQIQPLLTAARARGVPVVYTTGQVRSDLVDGGAWRGKNSRSGELTDTEGHLGTEIVRELAPAPHDLVLAKRNASAFFGTPLVSYLIGNGIDTLLVTGCTTSGCVRATVVDGVAYNFRVSVVEDAVFDRGQASHALSLWDIHAKYGDVVSSADTLAYLDRLARPASQP